jgi:hypothetical protein
MRQRRSLILVILAALAVGAIFGVPKLLDAWWYRGIPDLVPRSDVPIVRDLVYAPRTPEVEILEMGVKGTTVAQVKKTGGGCRFILQAKLRCRVKGRPKEGVPLIHRAQITARCVQVGDFGRDSVGDIEIRLVAGTYVSPNEPDAGDGQEISVTLEDVVDAISMGNNVYHVRCGGHTGTVELDYDPKHQPKIKNR